MQFLVDPGEEADRRVGERVAEGLRLAGLLGAVAAAFGEEPGAAGEGGAVTRRGREDRVLQAEDGVVRPGGGGGPRHVDVGGQGVGGVEEAHGAGYHGAPVAALGYWGGEET